MNQSSRKFTSEHLSYAFLCLLALLPLAVRDPYYIHVMILGGINIILAIGMNIITGYCGQINLGMAGFYAVGAYTSAILCARLGLSFWIALPIAAAVSAAAGFVVGVPALKVRRGISCPSNH